jgi:hypothetical protein
VKHDPSYINKLLIEDGSSITDYFIVDDLIMCLSEFNGKLTPMAFVIEDDDLMQACVDYLREKGIKQFDSEYEFEKWVGNKLDQSS